ASLVGQLYPAGDRRIDPAYTIFYMGINVGGALGPFLCGFFGDTGNPADFKWAFLVAGIGMLMSVLVQFLFQKKYLVNAEGQSIGVEPENTSKKILKPLLIAIGMAVFASFMVSIFFIDSKVFSIITYLLIFSLLIILFIIFRDPTLTILEKKKVGVIFIVSFFVVFFWSAFEQAGASLTFFADEQTNRYIGLNIPGWMVYVLSALVVFLTYKMYLKARKNLSSNDVLLRNVVYILLGLLTVGIIYGDIYFFRNGMQNLIMDEIPASFFQSLNSTYVVLFAPVFAWLWIKVGKYDPSSPTKMALGLFLLALGYLWIAIGVKGVEPGMKVSMMWLAGLYMLHTWGELCLSPIGLSLVNKLAPIKLASLMMAVWYLANAFANKLAGQLSALYPAGKTTQFLGFTMNNMYDFFILFVILSGTASLLLFLLTRWLQKLM
ncbi:MAG: peptide MFS transporter, partial [Chitinophagaceae bacterium]